MQLNKNEQLVISKISHELRNPLTIIYSTLQLIESRHPEARTFDHWHELMQDVEFMSVLLDDLSRFNHAGALNFSTFSFRPFWEYISLSFAASVADTKLEYFSKIDSSINQITGDKTKLQEVFLNLLRNAADAASPDGTISMTAEQSKDSIIIQVQDNGCGISKEHLSSNHLLHIRKTVPALGFLFLKVSYKPMAEQLRLTLLHKKDQRFGLRFQQSSAVTRIPVSNPPTWARLSTPPLVKPVYKLIRIITIIPCFVIFPTLP